MMRKVKILGVFFVILGLGVTGLQADIIEIGLTAEVAVVDDWDGLLEGQIKVGDIITGSYIYDSDTPDLFPLNPRSGVYWHYDPEYGISLSAGGFVFQTDPSNVKFLVGIYNRTYDDGYLLRSYNNLPLSNGVEVDHIMWDLRDYTGTALSSDALPTTPPVLEDWESIFGLTIRFGYKGGSMVRAHATSVWLVIEAGVDIEPDVLNLKSSGKWITSYIWLPEGYNVADIDPDSVRLEGEIEAEWMWFDEKEEIATAKFSRSELQNILEVGEEVELTVSGELADGTRFKGADTIKVIDKGRKKTDD